jgi:hypothetical protein
VPDTLTFTCSICGEPSHDICIYCTKDTCPNHLCERCGRCSDCCECNQRRQESGGPEQPAPSPAANNGIAPVLHEPSPEPAESEPADNNAGADIPQDSPE